MNEGALQNGLDGAAVKPAPQIVKGDTANGMAQFLALVRRDYDNFSQADYAPLLDAEAQHARRL